MRTKLCLLFVAVVFVAAVILLGRQALGLSRPMAGADDSVVSFRIRFGVTDTEPRPWDGTLSVNRGEVLNLRNWRPRPGDKIAAKTGWSQRSTPSGASSARSPLLLGGAGIFSFSFISSGAFFSASRFSLFFGAGSRTRFAFFLPSTTTRPPAFSILARALFEIGKAMTKGI
jgi:hypothetical protein